MSMPLLACLHLARILSDCFRDNETMLIEIMNFFTECTLRQDEKLHPTQWRSYAFFKLDSWGLLASPTPYQQPTFCFHLHLWFMPPLFILLFISPCWIAKSSTRVRCIIVTQPLVYWLSISMALILIILIRLVYVMSCKWSYFQRSIFSLLLICLCTDPLDISP